MTGIPDRPWIAKAEHVIRSEGVRSEDEPILRRLLTDPRMVTVWAQLTRRSRTNPARFFYPAVRHPDDPPLDAEEAQHRAMGMLLLHAFRAARDKRRATPIEEVQAVQRQRQEEAATLRHIADEIETSGRNAGAYDRTHNDMAQITADMQALRRVAAWREAEAAQMRDTDDPLTTLYVRSDPLAAGVQTTIAAFLRENFGDPMPKQAAIICAVALDLAEIPSERGSRSALLKARKRAKRQAAR